MARVKTVTKSIEGAAPGAIPYDELMEAAEPVVLKGAGKDWPLVVRARQSAQDAADYLQSFYNGKPVVCFTGPPEMGGRFAYNEDVTGMNFTAGRAPLGECLARILASKDDASAPHIYIGSTDVDAFFPGLREENGLVLNHPMFDRAPPLVGAWIGNRTIASTHYDMSYNIACCMVGRRRFTLFPPEQIENLYPGPLEPTPGGQVVSMADINAPDFDRYPRLAEALAAGQVAEMEPGDILFYPAMWWHNVEALDAFNVMINYWWNVVPVYMDTPQNTLLHGLLSLRDRPEAEKRAWKAVFDYYVFGPADRAGAHLPEQARGNLGPMDEMKARRLRALLLSRMNR